MKIQYGIAGFFGGVFTGLLLGLIEMRLINAEKYSAGLFFVISITIIVCAITGMLKGIRTAGKKIKKLMKDDF